MIPFKAWSLLSCSSYSWSCTFPVLWTSVSAWREHSFSPSASLFYDTVVQEWACLSLVPLALLWLSAVLCLCIPCQLWKFPAFSSLYEPGLGLAIGKTKTSLCQSQNTELYINCQSHTVCMVAGRGLLSLHCGFCSCFCLFVRICSIPFVMVRSSLFCVRCESLFCLPGDPQVGCAVLGALLPCLLPV